MKRATNCWFAAVGIAGIGFGLIGKDMLADPPVVYVLAGNCVAAHLIGR